MSDDQTDDHHQRGNKQMGNAADPDHHSSRNCQQRADHLDDIIIQQLVGIPRGVRVGQCAHLIILGEGDRLTNLILQAVK